METRSKTLFFCSTCGKPFDQETSHARHVQYCRRQKTSGRASRPIACHECRKTKTKCDFRQPCSRCVAKSTFCSYPGKGQATQVVSQIQDGNKLSADNPGVGGVALNSERSGGTSTPSDFDFAAWPFPADGDFPAHLAGCLSPTAADGVPHLFSDEQQTGIPSAFSMFAALPARQQPSIPADLELWSNVNISRASQQLIISVIRGFPRMMAQPNSLPPIIHPLSCGRFGSDADSWAAVDSVSEPPKSLAACMSISQIVASRIPNSQSFVWTMIDHEVKRIKDEMHQLSQDERVASIQALVIYTIIRMTDSGVQYFSKNTEMVRTMKKLAEVFAQNCVGPFCPPRTRQFMSRPSWEEWVQEETRRRLVVTCFLLAMVLGSERCNLTVDPYSIPLPSDKALWEARNPWAWEKEFDAFQAVRGPDEPPRFDTLGDLVAAKQSSSSSESGLICENGSTGVFDGALDDWHAGLDGVGMMLAAVLAGL